VSFFPFPEERFASKGGASPHSFQFFIRSADFFSLHGFDAFWDGKPVFFIWRLASGSDHAIILLFKRDSPNNTHFEALKALRAD
jgi:hypothetical protein